MTKRGLVLLAVLGLACGVIVGVLITMFVPKCGDPCGMERFGSAVLWGVGCLASFPLIGWLVLMRSGYTRTKFSLITGSLVVVTIGTAAVLYGYELHTRYWENGGPLDVPNIDFSAIAIATKPLSVKAYGTNELILVKAWERCAIGISRCDEKSRTVEAICFDSRRTVLIEERLWAAFQRIPEEDLQELVGLPKDVNFCSHE